MVFFLVVHLSPWKLVYLNPLKTGSSKPLESGFIIFSLCSLHEIDCYIPGVRVVLLCGEHFACFVKILKLQKQLF